MRKMGLLDDKQSTFESRNKSVDPGQQSHVMGFRMQDIKSHMLEQLDNIQVYDNINTKDAMKQAFDKKSRDLSALKSSYSQASLRPDESKTASPLKRAKSAMQNKKIQDKRASFTTDPKKTEAVNVKRQAAVVEDGPDDFKMKSPSRLTKTPGQRRILRGGNANLAVN